MTIKHKETVQNILTSLTEGVIVSDQNGEFLFFNQAAERILGVGYSNSNKEKWAAVYGCYINEELVPFPSEQLPLARAIKGERVDEEQIFIKNYERPDGIWISISASPMIGADGSIIGGTTIFRDISELKKTHEKMKQFARAVEQTADSIVITNKEGVIQYVNPTFEKITGYSREEAIGETPRILKSSKHNESFYNNLWRTISNGEAFRGTIINKKKNGELFWSDQTITPLKDDQGNITSFVSLLKDITEQRKQNEQEFQMRIAEEVQQRVNAKVLIPGFDIAGVTYSALQTSGDYHDFILMPDGTLWIVVGDVTGHGISAALIMMQTRAYLRAFAKEGSDPAEILKRLNHELVEDLLDHHFVTLILAKIDTKERTLTYASAGHVPGYLFNDSGEIEVVMESTGVPLGFMKDFEIYNSETIKLSSGNIAAFLTDGVMEAESLDEEQFGFDRALEFIKNYRKDTAQQIAESLYKEVMTYTEKQPQEDDITSVICKVL